MIQSWNLRSNPFVATVYREDDPNKYADMLVYIYQTITEVICKHPATTPEISDAIWKAGGSAATTAITTYQGALKLTNFRSVSAMVLLRESISAIMKIGTDWSAVPSDDPGPGMSDVLEDLVTAFSEWEPEGECPTPMPRMMLRDVILTVVQFNQKDAMVAIDGMFGNPPDAYDVAETPIPEVHTMGIVVRWPLLIGAIHRWRQHWGITSWNEDKEELELSDASDSVAMLWRDEMGPMFEALMEQENLRWPEWAEGLLPFAESTKS